MTYDQFSEKTNGAFDGSYWATYASDEHSGCGDIAILHNRLDLFEQFGVKGLLVGSSTLPLTVSCAHIERSYEHDHQERYLLNNGEVLLLVSNYMGKPAPWLLMAEYPALYSDRATSYVRTFPDRKALRRIEDSFDDMAWCFGRRQLQHMGRNVSGDRVIDRMLDQLQLSVGRAAK